MRILFILFVFCILIYYYVHQNITSTYLSALIIVISDSALWFCLQSKYYNSAISVETECLISLVFFFMYLWSVLHTPLPALSAILLCIVPYISRLNSPNNFFYKWGVGCVCMVWTFKGNNSTCIDYKIHSLNS